MRTPAPGPRIRALDVVALAVVVVLLFAAGVGVDRVTRDGASAAAPVAVSFEAGGPPADIRDDFRGPDAPTLGNAPTGQRWQRMAGAWGIRGDGATRLRPAVGRPSLVLADLGSADGRVTVTATAVAPGSGLVVRARSASEYWMVLVDPYSLRWALARVAPGRPRVFRFVGTERARPGDVVEVTMTGDGLIAAVNAGVPLRVTDRNGAEGAGVGFIALLGDEDTGAARWSDLVATADPAGATATTRSTEAPPATGFAP